MQIISKPLGSWIGFLVFAAAARAAWDLASAHHPLHPAAQHPFADPEHAVLTRRYRSVRGRVTLKPLANETETTGSALDLKLAGRRQDDQRVAPSATPGAIAYLWLRHRGSAL